MRAFLLATALLAIPALSCSDADEPTAPTAVPTTPSEQPTAGAAPTATRPGPTPIASSVWGYFPTINGVLVQPLAFAEERDLPRDVLVYFQENCYGCDGGAYPIHRAYVDGSGSLRREEILASANIASARFGPEGWPLVAAHCPDVRCYYGDSDGEHLLTITRSEDGGMSFRPLGQISRGQSELVNINGDNILLQEYEQSQRRYRLFNTGQRLFPPESLPAAFAVYWPGPDSHLMWVGFGAGSGTHWYDQAGNGVVGDLHPLISSYLEMVAVDGTQYFSSFERGSRGAS